MLARARDGRPPSSPCLRLAGLLVRATGPPCHNGRRAIGPCVVSGAGKTAGACASPPLSRQNEAATPLRHHTPASGPQSCGEASGSVAVRALRSWSRPSSMLSRQHGPRFARGGCELRAIPPRAPTEDRRHVERSCMYSSIKEISSAPVLLRGRPPRSFLTRLRRAKHRHGRGDAQRINRSSRRCSPCTPGRRPTR